MPGALITKILSQLQASFDPYARETGRSKARRVAHGGATYFVRRQAGAPPGIYQRLAGRHIVPVILFVHAPSYVERFPIYARARQVVTEHLVPNFWRIWREQAGGFDPDPSTTSAAYLEISGSELPAPVLSNLGIRHGFVGSECSVRNGRNGPNSDVGSSLMPRPASRNFAFEPEHIQAMHKAFDAVCPRLRLSTATGDRVTELVALRIIELAVAGERNAERLTARVLAEFGIGNDGSLWRH
jgi:hypothetical protein